MDISTYKTFSTVGPQSFNHCNIRPDSATFFLHMEGKPPVGIVFQSNLMKLKNFPFLNILSCCFQEDSLDRFCHHLTLTDFYPLGFFVVSGRFAFTVHNVSYNCSFLSNNLLTKSVDTFNIFYLEFSCEKCGMELSFQPYPVGHQLDYIL